MSDAEYFGRIKAKKTPQKPDDLSMVQWKRKLDKLEVEAYQTRHDSKVVREKENLANLFRRGEVFSAAELADRKRAEQEAKEAFELAAQEQARMSRFSRPKQLVETVQYTRERFEE